MTTPPDPSDADLLHACSSTSDPDAFGVFYGRYREPILGYLARRVDPEAAADLMAETFANALESVLSRRPPPEQPVAWLFAIARNLLVDAARRGRVEAAARQRLGLEPLMLDDDDLARVTEIAAAADLFASVASCLPASEWNTLRARVLDEEPYPQLARQLRCSEAVARKRVSRSLAHLRTALGGTHV